jgi:GAF domain-containing protein
VPLADADGGAGVLSVLSGERGCFTDRHQRLLGSFAALAAAALREARLYQAAERDRRQRETLLHLARRLAASSHQEPLMRELLGAAVEQLSVTMGAIYRWDAERQVLVLVHQVNSADPPGTEIPPEQGVVGLALQRGAPVVVDDYWAEIAAPVRSAQADLQGAIGIPVHHGGEVLGALYVGSADPDRRFRAADVELLELLAETAGAELIGRRRAQLEGVLLAARTAAHHLNNQLALTVGYSELLATNPELPLALRRHAGEALRGAQEAAETLARLQQVVRLEHGQPIPGDDDRTRVLDLERSSAPPRRPPRHPG